MADYLFPDFLSDPQQYQQAEALWRERFGDLIRRIDQEGLWESPWLNTHFANGTPCRDGNPIFSAVSRSRRLGIRVIQLEPSGDREELSAWTDTFAQGEEGAIKELVLACVLTGPNLLEALERMKRWITEEEVGSSREGETAAGTG